MGNRALYNKHITCQRNGKGKVISSREKRRYRDVARRSCYGLDMTSPPEAYVGDSARKRRGEMIGL